MKQKLLKIYAIFSQFLLSFLVQQIKKMLIIKFVLSIQCQYSLFCADLQYQVRPFKCPKFDASRILGEQNLRKKWVNIVKI